MSKNGKKKILVSACLLGKRVRYDGGHCGLQNPWLEELARDGLLVPFCPEVEAGMGTPRDPVELLDGRVVNKEGEDLTKLFETVFAKFDEILSSENIALALLKEKSPSCGVNQVYDGTFSGKLIPGRGLVAAKLSQILPVFSENQIEMAKRAYDMLTCD